MMTFKTSFLSLAIFMLPATVHAAGGCLTIDIADDEYPVARDKLIADGWVPKYLSPPFESAPFAEWVKVRNYAEVEACAPTGRANCKFTFTSSSNKGVELSVLTEGEELGIVTGHQCNGSVGAVSQNEPVTQVQRPIAIRKRWVRQSAADFYVAKTYNYEKAFDFQVRCKASDEGAKPAALYLSVGQDTFAGTGRFTFDNGMTHTFEFGDDGYLIVNSDQIAQKFGRLVSDLKARNGVTVSFGDAPPYKVSLKGSSKAVGDCPMGLYAKATTNSDATKISAVDSNSDAAIASSRISKVLPNGAEDVIDYRIASCRGTAGFGHMLYHGSNRTVLTDVCLNEETGDFLSAETLNGLELTAKGRNGRKFENLSSGGSFYERDHVQVLPDENIPGCTPENIESLHASIQSPKNKDFSNQPFGHFIGYTLPATASIPKTKSANIYFGLRSITPDPSEIATFKPGQIINSQGDMLASAVFENGSGVITVNEGAGNTYGDADGSFSINFNGDGTFTMSGSFSAESLRIKGHEPNEMIRHEGQLAFFRGHVLGSDGSGLMGYGIAEGKVTDASGNVHSYQAQAYLMACVKEQ